MEEQPKNFRQRILKLFDIFENVFALTFAIGLYLITKEITWSKIVLWIGIIGLTFLYLIKSSESARENIGIYITYKLIWLGYILALFGIYSRLEMLDKSQLLLFIAIGSMALGLGGMIIFRTKQKGITDTKDLVRLITFLAITFLFAIL